MSSVYLRQLFYTVLLSDQKGGTPHLGPEGREELEADPPPPPTIHKLQPHTIAMNRETLNRTTQRVTSTNNGLHQSILRPTPRNELHDYNILQAYRRTSTYQLDCAANIIQTPIALTNAQQHYHKHHWRGVLQTISLCPLGDKKETALPATLHSESASSGWKSTG